jgi:O-antigen/teichoic acid export membrane protein
MGCSRFFVQLCLTLYFVVIARKGIGGVIWAEAITGLLFTPLFVGLLHREIRMVVSWPVLKGMLQYGMPLVPAAMAMSLLNLSDRYFLKHFSTLEEVGLYSMGYKFGIAMAIAVGAFQQAWAVAMFRIAKEEDAKVIFSRLFTVFLSILGILGLGLSLFSKEVLMIFSTPPYYASHRVIPLVLSSYFFLGVYYYTAIGINLRKKTYYQTLVVMGAAILNLGLNYWLIPPYGMMGAAVATLVSFAAMGICAMILSLQLYYVGYEYRRITGLSMGAVGVFVVATVLPMQTNPVLVLFKVFFWVVYVGGLYAAGFFHPRRRFDEPASQQRVAG